MNKILALGALVILTVLGVPSAAWASSPSVETKTVHATHSRFVTQKHVTKYRLHSPILKKINKAGKWANTKKARSIKNRESGGNYKTNTGNGYYGAWQFDRSTWISNGGGRFASTANKAPRWAQDYVAYKTWLVRGWSPWGGA